MSYTSRKYSELTSQERKMVKRIIHASMLEQDRGAYQFSIHDAVNRAAFYTGLTPQVLLRIKANTQNTDKSQTKEPNKKEINTTTKSFKLCHRIILMEILDKIFTNEFLDRNPTCPEIIRAMENVIPHYKCVKVLYMQVQRFIKQRYDLKEDSKTLRKEFFENENFSLKRYTYLKEIREYRKQNRNIIYLDETWVDDKLNCTKSWENLYDIQNINDLKNEDISITLNAASKHGLLPEAFKMTRALKTEADTLQLKHFESWISLQLLRCLPKSSVIVVDNELHYECSMWRVPYKTLLNKEVMKSIKDVLESGDHKLLELPAYMSKLNPFHLMWDKLKTELGSESKLTKMSSVESVIAEKMSKITPEDWNAFDEEVRKQEEFLWTKDKRLLDNIEQLERLYLEEKNNVIVID